MEVHIELAAEELERLRLLREFELGVMVVDQPDPHVVPLDAEE